MSGPFDPNAFMTAVVEGANVTRMDPIPEAEYIGTIEKIGFRAAKEFVMMDTFFNILDENVKAKLGMTKVVGRMSFFIDLDERGMISKEKNKNVKLGRLREAVGQNDPNRPWSPAMLVGQGPVRITVKNRTDENDATIIYSDVTQVAPMQKAA